MWAKLLTLLVFNIIKGALHLVIISVLKYEPWNVSRSREESERAGLTLCFGGHMNGVWT